MTSRCKFTKGKQGYHFTMCGLDYVYLLNGYDLEHDEDYGELFSIHDSEALHHEIARNIVLHRKDITWQELRFLRSVLEMTQQEMADFLSKSLRHYQRWEKKDGDDIPGEIQSLVRILYWDYHMQNDSVVEMLRQLKRDKEEEQEFYLQHVSRNKKWKRAAWLHHMN